MDWGQLIVNIFIIGPALFTFFVACPLILAILLESFK